MKYLLNPRVDSLPGHIQCVYVQAIAKLFSRVLTDCEKVRHYFKLFFILIMQDYVLIHVNFAYNLKINVSL